MRLFNSFQLVAAFVAGPFVISFLEGQTFRGSGAAYYAACALYLIGFGSMVAAVYEAMDGK